MNLLPPTKLRQLFVLFEQGLGIRAAARTVGCLRDTAMRWRRRWHAYSRATNMTAGTLKHLKDQLDKLDAEHQAKAEDIEREWLLKADIKPDDLYPSEERARRFEAALTICALTPSHGQKALKGRQLPKELPSTKRLEARAQELRAQKNPAAQALGRRGGLKGGPARAKALSPERRTEIARKAGKARWSNPRKKTPSAEEGEMIIQGLNEAVAYSNLVLRMKAALLQPDPQKAITEIRKLIED